MPEPKADLVEIFSSYQGEGIFVGVKQIFIRFAGCNLDCSFCDTSKTAIIKNASVEDILKNVREMRKRFGPPHSVSLTGGEPLLYTEFLGRLLPELKKAGFNIYLETNGTLTKELKRIIAHVDIIAMDIKLPSSTGIPPLWEKHMEFLHAARKKNIFIKAVVTENTSRSDIIKARDIVEKVDRDIPFVLQPASTALRGDFAVSKEKIFDHYRISGEKLADVRIIPQVHKLMGIR